MNKEIYKRLEDYNKWRRGDKNLEQPNPTQLGRDIEYALQCMTDLEKSENCVKFLEKQIKALLRNNLIEKEVASAILTYSTVCEEYIDRIGGNNQR